MRLNGAKLKNRDKIRPFWKAFSVTERRQILFALFNTTFAMATPFVTSYLYRQFIGIPKTNIEHIGEIIIVVIAGTFYICVVSLPIKRYWIDGEISNK